MWHPNYRIICFCDRKGDFVPSSPRGTRRCFKWRMRQHQEDILVSLFLPAWKGTFYLEKKVPGSFRVNIVYTAFCGIQHLFTTKWGTH